MVIWLTVLMLLGSACFVAVAADDEYDWQPPPALQAQHDWLQLSTQEWIAGKVHALHGNRLLFYSRKFRLREYKWRSVRRLLTASTYTVATRAQVNYVGRLAISPDSVAVLLANGSRLVAFPREQLFAIVAQSRGRPGIWGGKLAVDFSLRSGNSDQQLLAADFDLRRRTVRSRWMSRYLAQYSKTRGRTSVNNHRLSTHYDWLLRKTLFLTPIHYEFFRDPFTNVSQKHTFLAGAGVVLSDRDLQWWDIQLGAGYQHTTYSSVEAGNDKRADTPVLALLMAFERELTRTLDLETQFRATVVNEKSGQLLHHWKTGLALELTALLDLELTFIWDRVQKPRQDSDGSRPDKDDFRLLLGIGVTF